MKKTLLFIGLIFGLGFISKAQHFVSDLGYSQPWSLPMEVRKTIRNHYPDHVKMHTEKTYAGYNTYYHITLKIRGEFSKVTFNQFGDVIAKNNWLSNPIRQHRCTDHCGYFSNYYNNRNSYIAANHRRPHAHKHNCGHYRYYDGRNYYYSTVRPNPQTYIICGNGTNRYYRKRNTYYRQGGMQKHGHPKHYSYYKKGHRNSGKHGQNNEQYKGHKKGSDPTRNKTRGGRNGSRSNSYEYSYGRSW